MDDKTKELTEDDIKEIREVLLDNTDPKVPPSDMRQDTHRTDEILQLIEEVKRIWLTNPDLRLGQLISNFADDIPTNTFYLLDSQLLDAIKATESVSAESIAGQYRGSGFGKKYKA